MDSLEEIAKALVSPGKGILAADESLPTIERRFASINVSSTQDSRKSYRELLFTTAGIEEFISGIIMFDETLRLTSFAQGKPSAKFVEEKGIIPGIKVDEGTVEMPGSPNEKITKGIEGLSQRLEEYKSIGAKFTKWRAVFTIGNEVPSIQCVEENAKLLAEFAKASQEAGLVPIVEPEVLMDGIHDILKTYETTRAVLKVVFIKLKEKDINLAGMLLKPNMILPGKESGQVVTSEEIAHKTLEVLKDVVPAEVPGIVFLSGGQSEDEAASNLREINKIGGPWQLSFSFGRALQNSALKIWLGMPDNKDAAQQALYNHAKINSNARYGK